MYLEYYHITIMLGCAGWGVWVGWMLRGDCNNDKLFNIQHQHMKEIFRTRKARLCELLDLPIPESSENDV